jgi:hypothetical protein
MEKATREASSRASLDAERFGDGAEDRMAEVSQSMGW